MFRQLLLGALVAVSAISAAQHLPSAPHLTISQRSSFLLLSLGTREELKLSPAQAATLQKAITTHAAAQKSALAAKPMDEKKLQAADAAYAKTVWDSLDGLQQKALLVKALREVGVYALVDPEISERLRVTKDQKGAILPLLQKMREREEEWGSIIAKGMEHFLPPKNEQERAAQAKEKAEVMKSYKAQRALLNEEQGKTVAEILALLDEKQREQWKALTD